MAIGQAHLRRLVLRQDEALIALPETRDGEEVTIYYIDGEATTEVPVDDPIEDALALAGAWSHLDWDEMESALDRIRHESSPTPPIDDL